MVATRRHSRFRALARRAFRLHPCRRCCSVKHHESCPRICQDSWVATTWREGRFGARPGTVTCSWAPLRTVSSMHLSSRGLAERGPVKSAPCRCPDEILRAERLSIHDARPPKAAAEWVPFLRVINTHLSAHAFEHRALCADWLSELQESERSTRVCPCTPGRGAPGGRTGAPVPRAGPRSRGSARRAFLHVESVHMHACAVPGGGVWGGSVRGAGYGSPHGGRAPAHAVQER